MAQSPTAAPEANDPANPGGIISKAGWALFALGALVVVIERGSETGGCGAAALLAGALLAVGGRFYRDRAARAADLPTRPTPLGLPLGAGLILFGLGALLYPTIVSRADFRALVAAYPFGPLVAVCLGFAGIVIIIDYLDRPAPAQVPFGIPEPTYLRRALICLGPIVYLLAIYPLAMPSEFSDLLHTFPLPFYLGLTVTALLLVVIGMRRDYKQRYADTPAPRAVRYGMWFGPVVYLFPYLLESWKEIDAEAERARADRKAKGLGYDLRPIVVLCTGAVLLALMEYFGHANTLRELVDYFDPLGRLTEPETFFALVRESPFRRLLEFVWWSGWRLFGFFLVPAAILLLMRERPSTYGLQTRGFSHHAWIYLGFYTLVLLTVVAVSYEDTFHTYYPFYNDASRSWYDFWAWEAIYAVQFFSLEFFFRGFWVNGTKTQMGSHAIFAMVVPYCMIHFGKPYLETNGAIVAGIVLGTLALRTRSIWAGFLIHVSVAISMDIAALLQTTGLPSQWWPDL